MSTSASNPHGSPKAKSSATVNSSMPTIPPLPPSSKARAIAPRSLAESPASCRNLPRVLSLPTLVPQGNPSDPSYVLPLLDKVQSAIDRVQTGPKRQIHSVAGDLGINDAALRQALHARGILTVGIPKTIEPIEPQSQCPGRCATSSTRRAYTASAPRIKCSWPVPVAIVVRWWKATSPVCSHAVRATCVTKVLRARCVQQGMTVMAHNGAVLVRIRQTAAVETGTKVPPIAGIKDT